MGAGSTEDVESTADGDDELRVRVQATGHENVSAEHASTFELTSDDWLTPAGDCILAVEADTVPADLDEGFVEACRSREATITATLTTTLGDDGHEEGEEEEEVVVGEEKVVEGRGHPGLTFESDRSMVFRTSDHVDERTVMVGADAAAADLDREFADALAEGADLECVLAVER